MMKRGLLAITRAATTRRAVAQPAFRSKFVLPKAAQFRLMSGAAEAKEKEPEPKAEASEPAAESTQAAAEPAAEEAAAEAEPTVEEKLQARVEELEAENLEMVDRWKRSLADAENTRQ